VAPSTNCLYRELRCGASFWAVYYETTDMLNLYEEENCSNVVKDSLFMHKFLRDAVIYELNGI
jgi:hypothetical protein